MLCRSIAVLAILLLTGCNKSTIEVQSDTSWSGFVNQADVVGEGYCTYELWEHAGSFVFTKETDDGYLRVRFKRGSGDEPETTAPYGTIIGSAW